MAIPSRIFLRCWRSRLRKLIDTIWKEVVSASGPVNRQKLLLIDGVHPVVWNTVNYSGVTPYLVYRKIGDASFSPLLKNDPKSALEFVCSGKYMVDNIYSWYIDSAAEIHITTAKTREMLYSAVNTGECPSGMPENI